MIHYSCDRCKRMLDPERDVRYVVKLEAFPAMEPLDADELEDDRDHLSEIQQILDGVQEEDQELTEELYLKQRFDLCYDCYKEFLKNPVGREPAVQFDFSEN